jgi:ABC-type multidrug transport system fused ATPase/permease subunit
LEDRGVIQIRGEVNMGFDMNEELLDTVLNFLDNGDDLPEVKTDKKWRELQKALFKQLYSKQGETIEQIGSVQSTVDGMSKTLDKINEKLVESPTVLFWVKGHLLQTGAMVVAYSVFMLTLWFALHIIAHSPGFEAWMHLWLNIPEFPY